MDLIAVAETRNPNILSSDDEQTQEKARIFEEYANGGFEILASQVNGVGNIAQQILLFVTATQKSSDFEDLDILSFL
jgi:dnd system-associated protein 4